MTLARVGIQTTDAYTVILARVCGTFVYFQIAELSTVPLGALTVECSCFINAFSPIDTRCALCAKTERKFALIARVYSSTQAFERIHLQKVIQR